MVSFFILYLTALGLGEWLGRGLKLKSAGLTFLSGWAALAILLTALPLLGMPLIGAAREIFLVGFAGAAVSLYRQRRDWRASLAHPLFLWPLVYVVFQQLILRGGYVPVEGDEFSHWVTMPRQILLFKQVSTPDFFYKRFLEYTPGWPLLLDYPLLVIGSAFTPKAFLYAPFLASLAALGALYELLGAGAVAWAAVLFLARMKGGVTAYPFDLLVEPPLEASFTAFAVCLFWIARRPKEAVPASAAAGLTLAYAYLIKKAAVCLVPGALLIPWLVPAASRRKCLAFAVLPIVAAASLWRYTTASYPHLFVLAGAPDLALGLFGAMLNRVLQLAEHYWLGSIFVVAAMTVGWRNKQDRRVLGVVLTVFVLYFVGLHWLYITTFPGREGFELRSIERYTLTAFRWLFAASAAILLPWLATLAFKVRRNRVWLYRVVLPILAFAVLEQTFSSFMILRKRVNTEVSEGEALASALTSANLRGTKVLMLDHGINVASDFRARYAAMDRADGMAFELYPIHWFIRAGSKESYDQFAQTETLTDEELQSLIRQSKVVWPLILSDWERAVLEPKGPLCGGPVENFFSLSHRPRSH